MTPDPASYKLQHTPARLAGLFRDWAGSEGERWIFVAKTLLAAFTALWLAFRLGLDSPNTAMTTTFILALPSSGMVLEKAFYRLLGTLVGCASALLLVAVFPQQAPLMFIGLALWIAACTCGAAMYRNQQSYSFVLAGYTAAMIAIPALDHPAGAFALAVTRVVEVSLGVICATVMHDALFPRHQSAQVMRTVQARYLRFLDFCRDVLEHKAPPAETELAHLRFAADIAALESGRAAAFFEAAHARAHTRQLHAFNSAFMAALTTFYTLHRLTHRLRQDAASPVPALIEPLLAQLAAALARGEALQGPALDEMQTALAAAIAAARSAVALAPASASDAGSGRPASPHRIDFETAIELLERFAHQFGEFAAIYHGLAQRKRMQASEPQAYTPKTPPAIVLASGFRAATALLTVAGVWYWMAWPYAVNAALMTAIFCALASSSPRPTAMIKQVMQGFLIAWPLSFFTEFFLVMPGGGYPMLVLAAAPLFAVGAYVTTDPKRAGVGIGITLFSAQVVAPLNLAHYDVAAFLNTTLAMPFGVALAWAIFAVVLPEHTMGHRNHVAAALWREALATCTAPLRAMLPRLPSRQRQPGRSNPPNSPTLRQAWRAGTPRLAAVRHRFDNRVRDLLSQLNAASGPAPNEAARAVVRQGLTLLELGHSVLELRALIADAGRSEARSALQDCVSALAAYFKAPTQERCATAVGAVLRAGAAVRAALPEAELAAAPLPGSAAPGTAPQAAAQADAEPASASGAVPPPVPGPAHTAPGRAARLRSALTDLHSIYTSLLDQLPQTSASTGTGTSPGVRHAS
jgi:uncharacterized membrane protein YccC